MAFTNDILLRTLQFMKMMEGDIKEKKLLMLGKQSLFLTENIFSILEESDINQDIEKFGEKELTDSISFFKALGFKEVHALDMSDYENADIIFNLNDDLPEELVEEFDVVFDGGVIEHVFDAVKAFKNMCRMTKVGGYIFSLNPIYNYIYNTYWNFSSEVFLDFYAANEYKILDCSIITFLANDIETRGWGNRPVIWSPDIRFLNEIHPLYTGKHIRSLHTLAENPHPHIFVIAKKTNDREFIIPTVG